MTRLLAAALLFAASSAFAKPKASPGRLTGTVLKSSAKISPGPDGPVFREGRLTVTDAGAAVQELKASPRTKITLDGKPAQFKAALPGTLVLRALFDPATKVLTALDLKSAPRLETPPAPGLVTGEVAGTDILKGTLSVRVGPKDVREFAVTGQTAVAGKDGKPLAFEALSVGDPVEVSSPDGVAAEKVRVTAAP